MRTDEGLILLNRDGTVLWANAHSGTILGYYSSSELVGLTLPLVDVPSGGPSTSAGAVANAFCSLLAGSIDQAEGEGRFPDKDGKRVAVHWKLWMLPDVQQEKRILLALSEAAQASADGPVMAGYRDAFEFAVEGIFRSSLEGRFLEVNPALARLYGYQTPAEFMAANWDINQLYVRPNRRAEFCRLMEEQGVVAGLESEVRRADGSVFWIAEFARTVWGKDHSPLYFEGSVIDITERQRTNAALEKSEERFRRLVETTHVIPFEFDPFTRTFLYLGPKIEALVGGGIFHGCTLEMWMAKLHPDDLDLGTRFAFQWDGSAGTDFQTEFRIRTKNGQVRWLRQFAHCGSGNEQTDHLVRGFFLDITVSKEEEEERERSRLQIRQLAARSLEVRESERMIVAREIHDEFGLALALLKIDLAWFSNYALASIDGELRKPLEERVEKMEQLIQATLQSVRRIVSSLRPPLLDELGLKDAIEFQVKEFSKRAGIRYEFVAEPVRPLPVAAVNAVFRIFQESLTNIARHATASRIKICLHETDCHLILKVEDNGRGISPERFNEPEKFGLLGMRERAWSVGGELEIVGRPGGGTSTTLRVPYTNGSSSELPS